MMFTFGGRLRLPRNEQPAIVIVWELSMMTATSRPLYFITFENRLHHQPKEITNVRILSGQQRETAADSKTLSPAQKQGCPPPPSPPVKLMPTRIHVKYNTMYRVGVENKGRLLLLLLLLPVPTGRIMYVIK